MVVLLLKEENPEISQFWTSIYFFFFFQKDLGNVYKFPRFRKRSRKEINVLYCLPSETKEVIFSILPMENLIAKTIQ